MRSRRGVIVCSEKKVGWMPPHTPQQMQHDYLAVCILDAVRCPMMSAMGLQPKGTIAAVAARVAIHATDPACQFVTSEQQSTRIAMRQTCGLFNRRVGAEQAVLLRVRVLGICGHIGGGEPRLVAVLTSSSHEARRSFAAARSPLVLAPTDVPINVALYFELR